MRNAFCEENPRGRHLGQLERLRFDRCPTQFAMVDVPAARRYGVRMWRMCSRGGLTPAPSAFIVGGSVGAGELQAVARESHGTEPPGPVGSLFSGIGGLEVVADVVLDCDGCTGDRCPGGCPILELERAYAAQDAEVHNLLEKIGWKP